MVEPLSERVGPGTGENPRRANFAKIRGAAKPENHSQPLRREAGARIDFGALIRAAEGWRGPRFTEFELRQIVAVGMDLDDKNQS